MIESISYTDADRLRDQTTELKRQAKMFKTSNILSSLLQGWYCPLFPRNMLRNILRKLSW